MQDSKKRCSQEAALVLGVMEFTAWGVVILDFLTAHPLVFVAVMTSSLRRVWSWGK